MTRQIGNRQGRVFQVQMAGLVFCVHDPGKTQRGGAIETDPAINSRILDRRALIGWKQRLMVGAAMRKRP